MSEQKQEKDIRLRATIWIWGLSIPVLFACVPIIAVAGGGIVLPLFVLSVVAVATFAVWGASNKKLNPINPDEIRQLQERVANLETIASHEGLDSRFKALE